MALTITNSNSLTLLNILNKTSQAQSDVLTRMSTGSRINKGSDDPAGLIALRGVEIELQSVDAAISNNQRTSSMLGVADKQLTEVASMLANIQSLAQKSANSAGLSASELAANQAQIDNAIAAIDRIVGTTEVNGKKLLDGSLGINVTANAAHVKDVSVFARNANSSATTISVSVSAAAEKGLVAIASAAPTTAASLSIQGESGAAVIEVANGDTLTAVRDRINDSTAQTGVSAFLSGGTLRLRSTDYGSEQFVRVQLLTGTAAIASGYDAGVDAEVLVNGQKAAVDGLNVNFSSGGLDMSFNLVESWQSTPGSTSVTVANDGGATFQLGTDASTRATVGISGMFSHSLGASHIGYLSELKSGGTNSVLNDPAKAAEIAAAAAAQVAKVQGRLGGFDKFQVQTALNALSATKEGLTSARSTIADVDYATETAELNKQNVLLQSAISLLGLANQQSSQILNLLR